MVHGGFIIGRFTDTRYFIWENDLKAGMKSISQILALVVLD